MRKKFEEFENMSPNDRRDFLKLMSGILGAATMPASVRDALREIVFGPKAYAQANMGPMFFLEVNVRDQWDFGSLFVPPTVARNYEGIKNRIALFDNPIAERNNFYVTPQANDLRPHLDNIAVMELGECALPGNQSTHGHEAGNPLRSPGRTKSSGGGRMDMSTVDKRPGGRTGGNEILYSSSPTPLVLHNYVSKLATPNLRNGVLFRSSIRSGVHTFYHYEASLANAQVDRFFDKNTFLNAFGGNVTAPTQTNLQKHGATIAKLLKRVDSDYLNRTVASTTKTNQHLAKTDALAGLLPANTTPTTAITMSAAELNYWRAGVPDQVICPGDNASACVSQAGQWNIGELFGYAFKLFQSGRVRSVGIDFDMHDIHSNRTPFVMRTQGSQVGLPLARLIQSLKTAGIWDRTVIAMYTIDGSRSPLLNSYGDDTKNAVVLCGGGIRGGYYGDLRVDQNNGTVTYYRPDDAGNPVSAGTTGRDRRVPAADVYKTVAKAAGIPDTVVNGFPDIRSGQLLSYMLR